MLDNENFEGVGSSKKQARNKAAQAALQMASGLERINPPEPPSVSTQPLNSPEPPSISTQPFKPPEIEFGDYIARYEFLYSTVIAILSIHCKYIFTVLWRTHI